MNIEMVARGKLWARSDSQDARIECHKRGLDSTPARRIILAIGEIGFPQCYSTRFVPRIIASTSALA